MSDVLLATKLHIPPLHCNLVNRPHLIQRLNDGISQSRRLTLVSAPAGYGKSTLLGEWVSQVGMPIAWLSLGQEENTPARFWTYFVTALASMPQLHLVACCESLLPVLQSPHPPPMQVVLTNLTNELSLIEGEMILVLDDLHTITEKQIHQDLVFLINHLPRSGSGLHLVIASRMDPPWPLARWRGRNELTELRPADLRFSHAETVQFLKQALTFKLSSQDMDALQDRTEGWIAGLQMAVVSMQGRLRSEGADGVSQFVESFTGSNRFILDYLMEEVVSQQSVEMRDFLQATSILDRFTAPLCDALLQRQDSRAVIDQVERANLFLMPLDDERQWFRYHQLFTDLLRKSLKQTRPEIMRELHQRASAWYAENNFLAEAIGHALDAGDVAQLNKFVSGNALAMAEHSELQGVLRHFEQLPETEICSKPWLCVAYAWVKAYVDPTQGIGQILKKVLESISAVEDTLERQHLTSHLDAIWSYVAWVKGDADKALEFCRSALNNLPEDDWMTRARLLNIEGLALQYQDDLSAAIRSFEAAVAAGKRTGKAYESFHAYTNWAYAEILRGRLHQASSLCQCALSLADQQGLYTQGLLVLAYAYATLSIVQLEWNQVESAVASARQGVALAEQWRQADTLHFTLTSLSRALCAAGDIEEALIANRRAMQLATDVSPWFFRISATDEISLSLEKGDILAAARRSAELEVMVDERNQRGWFLVVKTSLLYAQKRYAEVILGLADVTDELSKRCEIWILMNLYPLQALALQALGREEEAINTISHCLTMARPEGYVHIFVKQGAPMLRLLQAAAKRDIEVEYINKLVPAFNIPPTPAAFEVPGSYKAQPQYGTDVLVEPLSERELQVLRLLDSPRTSEEVGRELYLSVNTIRTHIRNIYSKLDVHGRLEAIQKAKDLRLI